MTGMVVIDMAEQFIDVYEKDGRTEREPDLSLKPIMNTSPFLTKVKTRLRVRRAV